MKKKIVASFLSILTASCMLVGCGSSTEVATSSVALTTPTPEVEEVEEDTPTPTPEAVEAESVEPEEEETDERTPLPEGQMYSYLTGEVIETSVGEQRPFAVMINNIQDAIPQSGIGDADIIYEIQVEASITRLMAVFQDPSATEKIGPIRSARPYYIDFALDNEAIYAHYGWSGQAQERLENSDTIEYMNGQYYETAGRFYRSADRVAPHNVYVSGEGLISIAEEKGYDRSYPENYEANLLFNENDTELADGEDALTVYIPFSYDTPYFVYDAESGTYKRYEYGSAHIDTESGEQLAFENIIVTSENQYLIDDAHILMDIVNNSGEGYYFTDGKVIPITWEKGDEDDNTKYYDADGNQIKLNPGKTMFEIVPNTVQAATWSAEIDETGAGWNSISTGVAEEDSVEVTEDLQ